MANETILIVEDEPNVAALITRFLEKAGYTIAGWVKTGEEALAQAGPLRPHLALMDISLSGDLDGVHTAIRLREQFDLPVVFLTGLSDAETLERSQEAGAFGYIVKPFRSEDLVTSIDLALSKHAVESQLRQIERWFTAAIRSIADGVITTNAQGLVTFLNPVAETLTGWARAEAEGRDLETVFRLGIGLASESALLQPRDGPAIPVETSASPIRDDVGVTIGRVLVFRDISQRRRAEEEIRRSQEQIRALNAHAEQVRESERLRIAREVHDELGQMVTGLRMDLAWIEKRLAAVADESLRHGLAGRTRSMFELLDHMVKTVRRISGELRPMVLDDLGLVPALEWQARDWQARTGVSCQVSSNPSTSPISADRGTALFRIFQEALTNVARHAKATAVSTRFTQTDQYLLLEVRDNGRGITEGEQQRTKSFGLLGMKERAALLGGSCAIHGAPGQGTVVLVKIPAR